MTLKDNLNSLYGKNAVRRRRFSYDSECEILARHFLQDDPDIAKAESPADRRNELAIDLAQEIQQAIENWFECRAVILDGDHKRASE